MSSKVIRRCHLRLLKRNYCASAKSLWTPNNVVVSPHDSVVIPNQLLHEHVWENLGKWSEKTASICGITNKSYTYHQMYKGSRNFAASLRTKFRIKDRNVICVMMPNNPEYSTAVLGVLQAGAIASTMNPIYTSHEIVKQINICKPKMMVSVIETYPVIVEALKLAKMNIPIVIIKTKEDDSLPDGTASFDSLTKDGVDTTVLEKVNITPDDVAMMPFSSGTTGLPKGVELTHKNIVANCIQANAEGVIMNRETTASNQDSTLVVLPLYHIYGMTLTMFTKLATGVKMVTLPKFNPVTFLSSLKEHKINVLCSVPPMVLFLGSHADAKSEHLEHIHTVTCGAAPLPKNDIDIFLQKAKPVLKLRQVYGLTETSPLVTTSLLGFDDFTSAGHAIPNTEMKIVDSNHKALGPEEEGELLIRGPQVMKGYKDNPEATKKSITDDGWFMTGDLAQINKNGAMYIKDRLKELIKVKGYQVPPAEIENVIKEHPSVLDVAVVGIPDAKTGEALKAFIVLKHGHKSDAENIKDFVSERVAPYKRVNNIKFTNELPRNPSGKILRRLLKDA